MAWRGRKNIKEPLLKKGKNCGIRIRRLDRKIGLEKIGAEAVG